MGSFPCDERWTGKAQGGDDEQKRMAVLRSPTTAEQMPSRT